MELIKDFFAGAWSMACATAVLCFIVAAIVSVVIGLLWLMSNYPCILGAGIAGITFIYLSIKEGQIVRREKL